MKDIKVTRQVADELYHAQYPEWCYSDTTGQLLPSRVKQYEAQSEKQRLSTKTPMGYQDGGAYQQSYKAHAEARASRKESDRNAKYSREERLNKATSKNGVSNNTNAIRTAQDITGKNGLIGKARNAARVAGGKVSGAVNVIGNTVKNSSAMAAINKAIKSLRKKLTGK